MEEKKKGIDEIETDEEAREFIKAISTNGIEDEMEFLDFYERLRGVGYPESSALQELVYCYGLDLV